MERQVSHLVRLVDDLLEVSRITRGLDRRSAASRSISALVRARRGRDEPAGARSGRARADRRPADASRSSSSGDAVRLTQVFANLLTNAAKYTERRRAHPASRVRQRRRPRAIVSVRDNGIGIAAGQLASVFDMFTQVDRSNRRAQGGLGIGLTLVRSLVAMHGGRVEARSDGPGKGSEFVVELPLVRPARVEPSDRRRSAEPLPPRRILRGRRQPRCRRDARRAADGARRRRCPSRTAAATALAALDAVRAGRRAARHRHARHGRLRGGAADPCVGRCARDPAHCAHRLGAGAGSAAIPSRGLRPPSGQAPRHQPAAGNCS